MAIETFQKGVRDNSIHDVSQRLGEAMASPKAEAEDRRWLRVFVIAIIAALAWAHYTSRDEQEALATSRAKYPALIRECLERSGFYNLPEETMVQMCREEIYETQGLN